MSEKELLTANLIVRLISTVPPFDRTINLAGSLAYLLLDPGLPVVPFETIPHLTRPRIALVGTGTAGL